MLAELKPDATDAFRLQLLDPDDHADLGRSAGLFLPLAFLVGDGDKALVDLDRAMQFF